jgi:HD-GYP domain-containing protein (c-di-GMP phosphodiesterase class II)/tRNA A-37 threonylcarbamoyl transferase component Bud32
MNPLPPLRTVRTASQQVSPGAAVGASQATPYPLLAQPIDPVLNVPGLPALASAMLRELLELRLLDSQMVREFLAKQADKLQEMTNRERIGNALTHAGLLTTYQRDRVLRGRTFGLVLGAYRVLDRLGSGSVGVVFLGEHTLLRRRVAIKVLPVDDAIPEDLLERFRSEMRVLASLDHPHVVTAFDAGVLPSPGGGEPSLHYLILELVPGGDLEQFVYKTGRQSVSQACEWGRQAAAGLQAAHDRHLIHRDLKPSNLLLTTDRQVKLVDFGLARQLSSSITRPRTVLGSVDFMSPEQSIDPTAVSPAADVYGLGTTLFWMLTGQLPMPRGETLFETMKLLSTAKPRRARELRPDLPEALDALLNRTLARDPASRPSAVEVMRELSPFAADEVVAGVEPASAVTRLKETVRQLEDSLRAKDDDVHKAQGAILFAMAKMAESHDGETEGHLGRMQLYVRILADRLKKHPEWAVLADTGYVEELIRCVPLHDIGKIAIPDIVLNKPGPLDPPEWELIRSHATCGAELLEALAREHGESLTFLAVARSIVRHHHERWDGEGYPDRLAGTAIPLAARLVAIADVYDALRRDRPHRPGMPHAQAALAILATQGQFDPVVLSTFQISEKQFEDVWATIPN